MRLHDMLMTETPRPIMDDPPFVRYADLFSEAVVVDGTEVLALTMNMTQFDENGEINLALYGGDPTTWQIAQWFEFDWSVLGNIALPFQTMSVEFDCRAVLEDITRKVTDDPKERAKMLRETVSVGKESVTFFMHRAEDFAENIRTVRESLAADGIGPSHRSRQMDALMALPDLSHVLVAMVFSYFPGSGMVGPCGEWFIPVRSDGSPYLMQNDERGYQGMAAIFLSPTPGPYDDERDGDRQALASGWRALIPALLTINFMHTPQGEKGYHKRTLHEPPPKLARKYLARNFRPMSKWYVLDISPLRQAVRDANGGSEPRNLSAYLKALHIVRGNYAHYAPNTYFGQKHDDWKTVFRPAHRRGDKAAGVIDKDYRVEASA